MMFGDVGGLHDFIAIAIGGFLGGFSNYFMLASLAEKLYRKSRHMNQDIRKIFKPLEFTTSTILAYACTGGRYPNDRRKKFLKEGMSRV